MIDFRYHLVSLISVFMALAIGIILGAGPLQNSLGNVLSDQVDGLRESNSQMRTQITQLEATTAMQDDALAAAAPAIIGDALKGKTVTIIALPNANNDDIKQVANYITNAGGTVNGDAVTFGKGWYTAATTTFRDAFAKQIATYVNGDAGASDSQTILADALSQVLRGGPDNPANVTLKTLLTTSDTPLVNIPKNVTAKADAILFVGPRAGDVPNDADGVAAQKYETAVFAANIARFGVKGPTAALGTQLGENVIIGTLRGSKVDVSTIDSVSSTASSLNAVLALNNEIAGEHVSLGADGQNPLGTKKPLPAAHPAAPASPAEPAQPAAPAAPADGGNGGK